MRYWLVMPAAGAGRRFGGDVPKQYAELCGLPVIERALQPFIGDPRCAGIVLVLAADDARGAAIAARLPRTRIAPGGAERCHSVLSGLDALHGVADETDWVLVHDAARPCLDPRDRDRLLAQAGAHAVGGLLAVRVADTLKREDAGGAARETVDRAGLWRAQTPQMFRIGELRRALAAAIAAGRLPTDEAQAMEWEGRQPLLVAGSPANVKVTSAEDLGLAAGWFADRERSAAMRVGSGFDVHAFGPGDGVVLGGVRIAHDRGVVAHSDGDVVLHALCDALLGAAGLGDIGMHFPDTDARWRGADSSQFVREVLRLVRERGWRVVNADVTVLAQAPRLAPHRDAIRSRLAALLELDEQAVNLKATTTERLGFLGRSEGLAAQATVLLGPA